MDNIPVLSAGPSRLEKIELNATQSETLNKLQQKFLNGGILNNNEKSALKIAEKEGILEKRTLFDSFSTMFKGDKGKENAKGAAGVGVDVGASVGIMKFLSKFPMHPAVKLALTALGTATTDGVVRQKGIEGREKINKTEAGIAGLAEFVGPGIVKTGQALVRNAGNKISKVVNKSPLEKDALEQAEFIISKGGTPDLAKTFKNTPIEVIDGISSSALLSRRASIDAADLRQDIIEEGVMDFAKQYTMKSKPLALAHSVRQAIAKNISLSEGVRKRKLFTLDGATGGREGAKVDLEFLGEGRVSFKDASELLMKADAPTKAVIKKRMRSAANALDNNKVQALTEIEEAEMRQEFADLGMEGNIDNIINNIKQKTTANSKVSFADDLETSFLFSDKNGPLFNNTMIKQLAGTRPEQFFNEFFKNGNADTIKAVMNLTDNKGNQVLTDNMKDGLRAVFLGHVDPTGKTGKGLMTKSVDIIKGGGRLNGKKLQAQIVDFEAANGPEVSEALFGKKGLEPLKKLAKFLQINQAPTQESIGKMSVALKFPTAVGLLGLEAANVAAGNTNPFETSASTYFSIIGAGVIIFAPREFAKFLNNPKTFDRLLNGVQKRAGKGADLAFYVSTVVAQMQAAGINADLQTKEDQDRIRTAPPISGDGTNNLTQ